MTLDVISGNAWVFGDNIDTDAIYPGRYLHLLDPSEMASHAFEFTKPKFADDVEKDDIIIAGRNFGCGSSREHAVWCLKENGIGAVVALSFARIFYRNAINCALPVLTFDIEDSRVVEIYSAIFDGDEVDLDLLVNTLEVIRSESYFKVNKIPPHLMEIIEHGGLIEHLKNKI